MKIGFTGTRWGMTAKQHEEIKQWLIQHAPIEAIHHGCCDGSDDEMGILCESLHISPVIGHPPVTQLLTHTHPLWEIVLDPMPYLERNHAIVEATGILLATPKEPKERLRSGTWATVRYALWKGREVIVIRP